MATKIRLTRLGKKKQPTYRVVVMDSRKPRDGKYIMFIRYLAGFGCDEYPDFFKWLHQYRITLAHPVVNLDMVTHLPVDTIKKLGKFIDTDPLSYKQQIVSFYTPVPNGAGKYISLFISVRARVCVCVCV